MNAIYARQSIDKKESLSIEGQIALCKKHAGESALVFQDKGFSGKNTKRPAFTELMRAVEAGKVRKIFVYRLDRFSRSIADFSRLWETLERFGVEFNSVTEQFDTSSPIGRAMLNIVLVFAQLERETTAERVRDNYMHRFRLGAWPGGTAPYGFRLIRKTEDGRRISSLAADEHADLVRSIFREYAKPETSLRGIAARLNEQGIHGPKREAWDNATLSRMLRSPLYVRADREVYWYYLAKGLQIQQDVKAFDGIHACNIAGRRSRGGDMPGRMLTACSHEGLIGAALWLKVQDKLSGNRQLPRSGAGKHSWLTGLIKCGKCGYAVKINCCKPEGKLYLICSGRSGAIGCRASIRLDLRELEARLGAQIGEMLSGAPPDEPLSGTRETAAALLAAEQKIGRLIDALAESGAVSAAYISAQIERLHQEREALLSAGARRRAEPRRLRFEAASFEEKKLIARELIERVLLDGDRATVIWKV